MGRKSKKYTIIPVKAIIRNIIKNTTQQEAAKSPNTQINHINPKTQFMTLLLRLILKIQVSQSKSIIIIK